MIETSLYVKSSFLSGGLLRGVVAVFTSVDGATHRTVSVKHIAQRSVTYLRQHVVDAIKHVTTVRLLVASKKH